MIRPGRSHPAFKAWSKRPVKTAQETTEVEYTVPRPLQSHKGIRSMNMQINAIQYQYWAPGYSLKVYSIKQS